MNYRMLQVCQYRSCSLFSELHGHQRPLRPVPCTEQGLSPRRRLPRRVSRKHPRISSTSSRVDSVSPERRQIYDDQQSGGVLLQDCELDFGFLHLDILSKRSCWPWRDLYHNVLLLAHYNHVWSDVNSMPRNRNQSRGKRCVKPSVVLPVALCSTLLFAG